MAPQLAKDLDRRQAGPHSNEYVDVHQAAKILGVSASFLNKARIAGGGPPFAKFGHTVRYAIGRLREWAASQTHASTSEYNEVA